MIWPPEISTRNFFKFTLGRLGFAINPKKFDCKAESGRNRSETSSMKAEVSSSSDLDPLPPYEPVQIEAAQYINSPATHDPVSRSDAFLNGAGTWGKPGYNPPIWETDEVNLEDIHNVPEIVVSTHFIEVFSKRWNSQPISTTFRSGETDIMDTNGEPMTTNDWIPPSRAEVNNSFFLHDTNMLELTQESDEYNFSSPYSSPTQPKWEQTDAASQHDQLLEPRCNPQDIPKSTECAAPPEDTTHTSPATNTWGLSSLDLPVGVQRCKANHSNCEHSVAGHCPGVDAGASMSHRAEEGFSGLSSLASNQSLPSGSEISCLEDDEVDSDPAWMSDYSSDETTSLDENHPFLVLKAEVVRRGLLLHAYRKCATNEEASTTGSSPFPTGQGPQPGRPKRRNSGRGDEFPQERKDDGDTSRKKQKVPEKSGRQVSLACPFAKKDPLKYRRCYRYVLKRTQDVKQHLSRFHQLPIYCPRCRVKFHSEEERDTHARAIVCQPSDLPVYEGVTRAQKEQLTQRVSARMSLEDQWFTIFDVLFPGHNPRPRSAFVDAELTEDLEVFQDLMMMEGPDIILECIRTNSAGLPPLDDDGHNRYSLLLVSIAEGLQRIVQMWMTRSISDAAATGASTNNPTEQSMSSHSSHLTNNSPPSQASSGTLFELLRHTSLSESLMLLQEETDGQPRGQQPGTTLADTAEMGCLSFTIDDGSHLATGSVSSGNALQNALCPSIDADSQPLTSEAMDDDMTKAILHYIQDCADDQEAAGT